MAINLLYEQLQTWKLWIEALLVLLLLLLLLFFLFLFFFNYRHFRCSPNKTSLFEEQYNVRLDLKISVIGLKALWFVRLQWFNIYLENAIYIHKNVR